MCRYGILALKSDAALIGLLECTSREMAQKWMPHLKWSDRRPPMIVFESYGLLQKGVPYPLPAVTAALAEPAAAPQPPPQPQPLPEQAAAAKPAAAAESEAAAPAEKPV
jgi:hypothetical protein